VLSINLDPAGGIDRIRVRGKFGKPERLGVSYCLRSSRNMGDTRGRGGSGALPNQKPLKHEIGRR